MYGLSRSILLCTPSESDNQLSFRHRREYTVVTQQGPVGPTCNVTLFGKVRYKPATRTKSDKKKQNWRGVKRTSGANRSSPTKFL